MDIFFRKSLIFSFLMGGIIVAAVVYLTPLKHINVIEPTINDIKPVAFYNEFKQNPSRYIFIDVRPREVYSKSHAEGSINLPLHVLYDERHNLPKKGKEIILICSGGRASGVAYSYLEHFGFFNIKRIEGGIEAWVSAGLPTTGQAMSILNNQTESILSSTDFLSGKMSC